MEQRVPTVWIDGATTFQIIQAFIDDGNNNNNNNNDSNDNVPQIVDLDVLFPILGHLCGRLSDGQVPILTGFDTTDHLPFWSSIITTDHLKAFCAAFGTTASSPLIHIAGITPEANDPTTIQTFVSDCDTKRTIQLHDLYETFQKFNATHSSTTNHKNKNLDSSSNESIDLVALGNPHLSSSECTDLARTIQQVCIPATTTTTVTDANDIEHGWQTPNQSLSKAQTRIIACISREIYAQANPRDIRTMHEFGIEFIYDTCWCMILDEPIIPHNPLGLIMTNSGKYAHYGPGLTNRRFRFGSMYDCIYAARYGYAPIRSPLIAAESNTTEESTESSSSSKSIPVSTVSNNAFDPYLSFLIRPLTSKNDPSHPMIRRTYSTTTRPFPYTRSTLSQRIYVPQRRMSTTTTTTLRKVVPTLSLLWKEFCR
jgi:Aconitase X